MQYQPGREHKPDDEGHFWLEQNAARPSKWGTFAREGNDVAWEFAVPGGAYTGRMLVTERDFKVAAAILDCRQR